jgi:hypothetical protein
MRPIRFVSATSTALLAAVLALVVTDAPAADAAAGPAYVALGDSYSSGVGAGGYLSASGSCERSVRAYPQLWAAVHAPSSFAFTACARARTADVLSGQLGPLGPSTRLASITIGGNDAGFADVMTTCLLGSDEGCLNRVAQARSYTDTTLPGLLDDLYAAIRAKAPAARVVVLGYPRLYRPGGSCLLGMSDAKRTAVDGEADELDAVIAGRAAAHGFVFADVRAAFGPHEICSSGQWWLHSLTYPVEESYHPTSAGQTGGYLPVFAAAAGE